MQRTGGVLRNRDFWVLLACLAALFPVSVGFFLVLSGLPISVPRMGLPGLAPIISKTRPVFRSVLEGVERPLAVAVSPDGQRIYVAEAEGERAVRILDRNGRELGKALPPNSGPLSRQPMSVAVGADGTVYVADRMQSRVLKFSRDGQPLGELLPPDDTSWAPLAVGADSKGQLYVAEAQDLSDRARHRILVFDRQERFMYAFGSKGDDPAGLDFPHAVAVDSKGRVYVATLNAVKVFDAEGKFLLALGGASMTKPGIPMGLAIHDDELYVVDLTNHRLLAYDVSGDEPDNDYELGGYGVDSGRLRFPQGVSLSSDGTIFVADRDNNRVMVWSQ